MVKKPVVGSDLPDPPDNESLEEVLFKRISEFYSELCDELIPEDLEYWDDIEDLIHHLIKQTTAKVLQGDTCIGPHMYALRYELVV